MISFLRCCGAFPLILQGVKFEFTYGIYTNSETKGVFMESFIGSKIARLLLNLCIVCSLLLTPAYGFAAEENPDEGQEIQKPETKVITLSRTRAKAYAESESCVKITWKKVKNASGYSIYRYNEQKEKFKRIKSLDNTKRSYKVQKLEGGTEYRFKVAAYASVDGKRKYGRKSKEVKVTTLPNLEKSKSENARKLLEIACKKLGSPYRLGSKGSKKFDCSGFVYWVNHKACRKGYVRTWIGARTAADMYRELKGKGCKKVSVRKAKPGDIIFYYEGSPRGSHHVGFYLGKRRVIHASSSEGCVAVTSYKYSRGKSVILRMK